MRKMVGLITALALLAFAAPALAQPGQTEVCSKYDGKYELGGGWEGAAAPGITVGPATDEQVTVTVAAGFRLSQFCYKTGQGGGGATSMEAPIVGPATFTISKTNRGGGISHITFDTEATPTQEQPVDVCPNIEGDQETMPVGTVKNTTGDCVDDSEVSTEPVCFGLSASEMLDGNPDITVNEGGTKASITFTVKNGCELELSLTSYSAANAMAFPANTPQTLFDNETRTVAQGTYTMMVNLPACFYQVDFYYGPVLATVGEDGHGDRLIDFLHGGKACQTQQPVVVTVPGPERIVTIEKVVEVAGPERVVEKTVQVAGPERIVEVAGPTQVIERIVTVEKPRAVAQTTAPATKTITKVVTKTKVKRVVQVKRVVKIKRVVVKAKAKRPVVKVKRTSARRNAGGIKAERPRVLPFTP